MGNISFIDVDELLIFTTMTIEYNFIHNEKLCPEIKFFIHWLQNGYKYEKVKKPFYVKILIAKLIEIVNLFDNEQNENTYTLYKNPMYNIYKQFDGYNSKMTALESYYKRR